MSDSDPNKLQSLIETSEEKPNNPGSQSETQAPTEEILQPVSGIETSDEQHQSGYDSPKQLVEPTSAEEPSNLPPARTSSSLKKTVSVANGVGEIAPAIYSRSERSFQYIHDELGMEGDQSTEEPLKPDGEKSRIRFDETPSSANRSSKTSILKSKSDVSEAVIIHHEEDWRGYEEESMKSSKDNSRIHKGGSRPRSIQIITSHVLVVDSEAHEEDIEFGTVSTDSKGLFDEERSSKELSVSTALSEAEYDEDREWTVSTPREKPDSTGITKLFESLSYSTPATYDRDPNRLAEEESMATTISTNFSQSKSSAGIDYSLIDPGIHDELYEEKSLKYTASEGFDVNIRFPGKAPGEDTASEPVEDEDEDEGSYGTDEGEPSTFDASVVPFKLLRTIGMNTRVHFLNLTESNNRRVFFVASHIAVLYDYQAKTMTLLQGHQNAITSACVDLTGKYMVTADSGPENSIIVWRMSILKPVCTIFNANPGSGTEILTISPNGKYIVSVTSDMPAIIKLWIWSSGADTPIDTYITIPAYGKPVGVVFNLTVQERFMVTFRKQIVFMRYNILTTKFIPPRIPEIRNMRKLGKITDSCYLFECHECFASTSEGYIMVLGNTVYHRDFNIEDEYDAYKIFITAVKVSTVRIETINSADGVIVTGDARGHIKFYDKYVRILYWCQNFVLSGVCTISFNREPRLYKLKPKCSKPSLDVSDKQKLSLDVPDKPKPSLDVPDKQIRIDRSVAINDVSKEYEILYKNMVPSDATLHRLPFIVRNFIVATNDGNLVKIDYIRNEAENFFNSTETPAAAIDVHEEMPYLVMANQNGRVSLYDYSIHLFIHTAVLPPMQVDKVKTVEEGFLTTSEPAPSTSEQLMAKSVTCIKFSPKSCHLAVGRGNGELFFVEPVLLHAKPGYPLRMSTGAIQKIVFSSDFKYMSYYDDNHTTFLFYYDVDKDMWLMVGKHRAHSQKITDLAFSPFVPSELYSIGLDKCLVKYDIEESISELAIAFRRKIDQSALPLAFTFYPLLPKTHFLIADDQFKLKIRESKAPLHRHVFLGPAYGCFGESPIQSMSILPNSGAQYLIFATRKHIGIQKLPPDGNPYRYTGTIGHPYKIHQYVVSSCGTYIFTTGLNDTCILMWQINPEAVNNLETAGGTELQPYYCLIEGGSKGWLFQEMENLFYYMQILHQGENSQLPRLVSEHIAITELPDLMRACGFYPTEYQIETMLHDVKTRNKEKQESESEISFKDFIVLYVNHRPPHGVSLETLQKAFYTVADAVGSSNDLDSTDFTEVLCNEGESFNQEDLTKCISLLMHYNRTPNEDDEEEEEDSSDTMLPETLTFENFVYEILGIDMDRSTGLS